MQVVACQQHW